MKSAEDVIAEIEAAFLGMPIGELTLHQADLMDSYSVTDAQRTAARDQDPETDWRDVPDASLRECSYALGYLDPVSWRFYLPAYMTYQLRDPSEAPDVIYEFDAAGIRQKERHTEERFNSLDNAQVRAVCAFLRFAAENGQFHDAEAAREALDDYWESRGGV